MFIMFFRILKLHLSSMQQPSQLRNLHVLFFHLYISSKFLLVLLKVNLFLFIKFILKTFNLIFFLILRALKILILLLDALILRKSSLIFLSSLSLSIISLYFSHLSSCFSRAYCKWFIFNL